MATAEQLINAYVHLRDKKKELQEQHKKELAPYNDKLYKLEMGLLSILNADGAESMKTKEGTVYKKVRTAVKVENWEATLPYLIDNGLTHMLEKRLAKTSVDEFVAANGTPPPGVSITSDLMVGVRRPAGG